MINLESTKECVMSKSSLNIQEFFGFVADSWKTEENCKTTFTPYILIVENNPDTYEICLTIGAGKPGLCYNVGMRMHMEHPDSRFTNVKSEVVFDGVFTAKELAAYKQEIYNELMSYYKTVKFAQTNASARMLALSKKVEE